MRLGAVLVDDEILKTKGYIHSFAGAVYAHVIYLLYMSPKTEGIHDLHIVTPQRTSLPNPLAHSPKQR